MTTLKIPNRNAEALLQTKGERGQNECECVCECVFSQVTEHGRERYSFDPWNKERGEGKGESSRREGDGETGTERDE